MSLAENTYQVVLRLDPDNASSRKGLKRIKLMNSSKNAGNEAFKAGKWREAEQHYTQALELDSHLKSSFVAQCACNRLAPHLLPSHALLVFTLHAVTASHLYHILCWSAPPSLAHHCVGLA
jgi:tetratricopeptide (TPR) repeat protein